MITLQFVLADDIASRLIAWYGQGSGGFSHVDAVLPDGRLLGARSDKVGGQPPGVQIRPPDYEKWSRVCRVSIPVTSPKAQDWLFWLTSQVGRPYDMGSIWGFLWGQNDHTPGRWICSALQTAALEHIEVLPVLPVEPSEVTPNALRLIAVAIGGRLI